MSPAVWISLGAIALAAAAASAPYAEVNPLVGAVTLGVVVVAAVLCIFDAWRG